MCTEAANDGYTETTGAQWFQPDYYDSQTYSWSCVSHAVSNLSRSKNGCLAQTDDQSAWSISAISFATACYGGLHISAWHAHFPSSIEKIAWQVASVAIAGSGITILVLLLLAIAQDWLDSHLKS